MEQLSMTAISDSKNVIIVCMIIGITLLIAMKKPILHALSIIIHKYHILGWDNDNPHNNFEDDDI